MVNESELLINVVSYDEPKMLTGSHQKGKWLGVGISLISTVDVTPPAKRQDLTHSGIYAERDNLVTFPSGKTSCEASRQGRGNRKREKSNAVL